MICNECKINQGEKMCRYVRYRADDGTSCSYFTPITTKNNPYERQVGGSHYQKKHDLAQFCIENNVQVGEFSVMKYAYRHREKNGIEDLRKAKHWLEFLAYSVYGEEL